MRARFVYVWLNKILRFVDSVVIYIYVVSKLVSTD